MNATVFKSRLVKPKLSCPIYLDYDHGLNRYYGLQQLAENAGLVEKYSQEKFPDLQKPKEKTGKTTQKDCFVIKDPKLSPDQWFVGTMKMMTTKQGLGSILNEIDEYVKTAYKFRPPRLVDDEEGLDIDEAEVKKAAKEKKAKMDAEDALLSSDLNDAISDEDKE